MKSIQFLLLATVLLCCAISCNKEEKADTLYNEIKQNPKVAQRLQHFKQSLQFKSTDTISVDSAEWYLEGLINYEKANNNHQIINLEFFKDSLPVISEDGRVSIEQMESAYAYFTQKVDEAIASKNDPNYMMDMIDLNFKESQSNSNGTITIEMNASLGLHYIGSYIAFEITDYWYWGWDMGKCGQYQGQGTGQDAADQLEYRFNHPSYRLGPGYFLTDVDLISTVPGEYYDANNPGPYEPRKIFYANGYGQNPPSEPCLAPDELNFYLSTFSYVMNDKKPVGKTFKSVDVIDDFIPAMTTWYRFHLYHLYYATYVPDPGGH